ncbi:MAG: EAL domain-containing protein, partial [Henriciella sp.]|uniref:putative bifunctional diguanylate cyclase/phosphodiesterase n=1 Tax=Henriciella sp. TaxID=1968823 RepID=UPI003C7861F2
MLNQIGKFFSVEHEEPELNRERFKALTKQMPLMYGILTINVVGLAATHYSTAPLFLSVILPIVILAYTISRVRFYVSARSQTYSDEAINRKLKWTIFSMAPAGALVAGWGMAFLPYGDPDQNAQALFFNAVTCIACAVCMLHLRQAFLLLIATVIPITCVLLLLEQSSPYAIASVNLALGSFVLCHVLSNSERDFASLIRQKREQRQQHLRLQALNEENQRLANTDSLTSLANRRQFLADIDELIEACLSDRSNFVIALMDLDGFKPINDVFGHPAGDYVLSETARRLKSTFDGEDVTVARLGGDEFGLLFRDPGTDGEVMAMAQRACTSLRRSFNFDEGSANISATIGMARYPTAANSRSLLFERADYALYYAKHNSKSEPVFFSHEHERLIFANSALEQALRHADLEKEMSVEFQPVLDLTSGHTRGLEALARWYSPQLGRVRPDTFIKAAENIGMIGHLTEVLFRKAVEEARQWPADLMLSFNLSAISLTSTVPIQRLQSIADAAGVPPRRIMFEITESAVMKDYESAMKVLKLIREAGSSIAIDDFGTGFSSLAYVHRLPIDTLKVDRSFIRDLTRNEKSANVLRSILSLCANLEIGCVIEGV